VDRKSCIIKFRRCCLHDPFGKLEAGLDPASNTAR